LLSLIAALEHQLAERKTHGLLRTRRVTKGKTAPQIEIAVRGPVLQFGANDYLGLASDERIVAAAQRGLERFGVGAGASHLVTGHSVAHEELEEALAAFLSGYDQAGAKQNALAAVTLSSGYLANLAILTALCDRESVIFADKLNHACLNDGALLSRAQFKRFAHNDVDALAQLLNHFGTDSKTTKLIAVDGVFSMDGDIAPLADYLKLAEQFDAWLVVDDAHAFGVLGEGRGTAAHFGLQSDRLITMGTLGKAAGVAGAFVAAHPGVIDWIVNTARPYIYTTAQPPMLAVAASQALRIISSEHRIREKLQSNIAQFRSGCRGLPWQLLVSETAIQPLIIGDNEQALAVSCALEAQGIWVPAIRPPTVPTGTARLRVSLSAAHTHEQIAQLVSALHTAAANCQSTHYHDTAH
jgi:8-amino-7-oxononanoate synthase